jgi:RNA polymerase sigma factor (sigma-70 family)
MDNIEILEGELLAAFAQDRDESAFAGIVQRHGAMVLAVCRRITGDQHDAEDAAQAVFLILAQKANAMSSHANLAGWLHRCATYLSLQLRKSKQARLLREDVACVTSKRLRGVDPASEFLDESLAELPEKYRLPLLLHHLEGDSQETIALRLGLPAGTIASRLNHARKLLRDRLRRRGVALGAMTLAAATSSEAMSSEFVLSTAHAASAMVTGCAPDSVSQIAVQLATSYGRVGTGKAAIVVVATVMAVALTVAAKLWSGSSAIVPPLPIMAVEAEYAEANAQVRKALAHGLVFPQPSNPQTLIEFCRRQSVAHQVPFLLHAGVVADLRTLGDINHEPILLTRDMDDGDMIAKVLQSAGYCYQICQGLVIVGTAQTCHEFPQGDWYDGEGEVATRMSLVSFELHQQLRRDVPIEDPAVGEWVAAMNGPWRKYREKLPFSVNRSADMDERLAGPDVSLIVPLIVVDPALAKRRIPAEMLKQLVPDQTPGSQTHESAIVYSENVSKPRPSGFVPDPPCDTVWSALCKVAEAIGAKPFLVGEQIILAPTNAPPKDARFDVVMPPTLIAGLEPSAPLVNN